MKIFNQIRYGVEFNPQSIYPEKAQETNVSFGRR